MRLKDCDMKDAGGAIVRFVNERKFVWKISERGRDSSTSFRRVGEQRREDGRRGDSGKEAPLSVPFSSSPRRPVAPSLFRRVIPRSGARYVIGLFDSDVEFAERAVAFFVGRVE